MTPARPARFAAFASIQYAIATLVFVGVLLSRLPPGAPSDFSKQPQLYLPWLAAIGDTFLRMHVLIALSAALFITVPLTLYDRLRDTDARQARLALGCGMLAFVFILIYTLVDGFSSPVLGRAYLSGTATEKAATEKAAAEVVWRWMDAWRDEGMKTITYFFASLWLLINGSLMQQSSSFGLRFSFFTLAFGASMFVMTSANVALILLRQQPLADDGLLGLLNIIVLQVVWALWLGIKLWRA